jgi:hypothetical protein
MIGKAGFYDIMMYVAAMTSHMEYECISDCFRVGSNPYLWTREFCCTSQGKRARAGASSPGCDWPIR